MNTMNAVLVFLTVAVAGVGPFVAVHRGGSAYEFDDDEPEPEPDERADDDDDTTQIPRITVDTDDPYMY